MRAQHTTAKKKKNKAHRMSVNKQSASNERKQMIMKRVKSLAQSRHAAVYTSKSHMFRLWADNKRMNSRTQRKKKLFGLKEATRVEIEYKQILLYERRIARVEWPPHVYSTVSEWVCLCMLVGPVATVFNRIDIITVQSLNTSFMSFL